MKDAQSSNPICVACMLPSHIKNAFPLKDIDARDIDEHEKKENVILHPEIEIPNYIFVFSNLVEISKYQYSISYLCLWNMRI